MLNQHPTFANQVQANLEGIAGKRSRNLTMFEKHHSVTLEVVHGSLDADSVCLRILGEPACVWAMRGELEKARFLESSCYLEPMKG